MIQPNSLSFLRFFSIILTTILFFWHFSGVLLGTSLPPTPVFGGQWNPFLLLTPFRPHFYNSLFLFILYFSPTSIINHIPTIWLATNIFLGQFLLPWLSCVPGSLDRQIPAIFIKYTLFCQLLLPQSYLFMPITVLSSRQESRDCATIRLEWKATALP